MVLIFAKHNPLIYSYILFISTFLYIFLYHEFMKRIYDQIIRDHYKSQKEMLFLVGPRQVGKTTSSVMTGEEQDHLYYYNWDDDNDKLKITAGAEVIANDTGLSKARSVRPMIVFDEIHKYSRWRSFLKGFYDKYGRYACILLTGSARLDFYRKSGDSLMGRYFPFRMHPFSVAEILNPTLNDQEINPNSQVIDEESWEKLLNFGGFPKPFIEGSARFYNRWKNLRNQLLFKEDLRELTRVQELGQMEILAQFIRHQSTMLVSYASLARHVRVSPDTIRRWTTILRSLYYHYELRPWYKNVSRSLIKEPKFFLWDWALVEDLGSRFENFIASHLLKAVQLWTDFGFGEYGLYFLRDRDQREVDFLVTKNQQPWFLVEVKVSQRASLSKNLFHFQKMTQAQHAFQVVLDAEFEQVNCFDYKEPTIVPAKTFLSQLI